MKIEERKKIIQEHDFKFEISLSVLDHLGRNLYRNFTTVLGEAISNSWDANAHNVWIYIDREANHFSIKDDGDGMNANDFQNKFLRIGYSKRREFGEISTTGRPFIGRKGIGKLALLSCAEKISIISTVEDGEYVGGVIDNRGLDEAITQDLTPDKYDLGNPNKDIFLKLMKDHTKGTIIYFEGIKDGIRNRVEYLRKAIALYFRFSLIDDSFTIYLNDEKITLDDLNDLAANTQFLWKINELDDPYINEKLQKILKQANIQMKSKVHGFIASVKKPRYLKIMGTDEKVTIDLFVNGRLREKNILDRIPTDRLASSYLYGQIHLNDLDDKIEDRFTTARDGVKDDDPVLNKFIEEFKTHLGKILDDWDKWRIKNKDTGDSENPDLTPRERSSGDLYNAVSNDYTEPPPDKVDKTKEVTEEQKKIDTWVDELAVDAKFNFASYADCFISENLIRKYIRDRKIDLSPEAEKQIKLWKERESENKANGNISIDIRRNNEELSYMNMAELSALADKTQTPNDLFNDSKQYRPIRDGIMHTALLSDEAKERLTSIYKNIKGRVKTLLSGI